MSNTSINEIGRILQDKGLVSFGNNAYNQIDNNCHEIMAYIADMFGYGSLTKKELRDEVFRVRGNRIWSSSLENTSQSQVNVIVRCPDNPKDIHVSLEVRGKEYNYGPGLKEGFSVDMRIPLKQK